MAVFSLKGRFNTHTKTLKYTSWLNFKLITKVISKTKKGWMQSRGYAIVFIFLSQLLAIKENLQFN